VFALDYLTLLVCFPSLFYEGGVKIGVHDDDRTDGGQPGSFPFRRPAPVTLDYALHWTRHGRSSVGGRGLTRARVAALASARAPSGGDGWGVSAYPGLMLRRPQHRRGVSGERSSTTQGWPTS